MRHSSYYPCEISVYSFRIRRLKRGQWGAKVRIGERWTAVLTAIGATPVRRSTKREMIAHLEYAYGGKKKSA